MTYPIYMLTLIITCEFHYDDVAVVTAINIVHGHIPQGIAFWPKRQHYCHSHS